MGLLSRAELLTKEKVKIAKVDLREGQFVFVKEMTAHERDRFEQSMMKRQITKVNGVEKVTWEQSLDEFRSKLAVCTLCDENGNLLLKFDDFSMLSKCMAATTMEKIVETAQELNKISDTDKENLVKNSEQTLTEDSTLDYAQS